MAGVNKITRTINPKSVFEDAKNVIDSTISFNQGDLMYFDAVNNLIKTVTAETQSANFVGVARVTVVSGKLASPYNTDVVASQAIASIPGPQTGVIMKCVLKTGDSINPGDLVGLDPATGTRGVSVTITTNSIGIYQGPAIATAAAGTEVEIYLPFVRFAGDIVA